MHVKRYDNGEGIEVNYTEAVKWYLKAAAQGNAKAQGNLGVMYANGHGCEEDMGEAVRLYQQAADQGTCSAQCNLADMYRYV